MSSFVDPVMAECLPSEAKGYYLRFLGGEIELSFPATAKVPTPEQVPTAPVDLGALIMLALHAGRPVPAERFKVALYAGHESGVSDSAIQSAISRLRSLGYPIPLRKYILQIQPDLVDVVDFDTRARTFNTASERLETLTPEELDVHLLEGADLQALWAEDPAASFRHEKLLTALFDSHRACHRRFGRAYGRTLAAAGRAGEAIELVTRYIEVYPNDQDLAKLVEALREHNDGTLVIPLSLAEGALTIAPVVPPAGPLNNLPPPTFGAFAGRKSVNDVREALKGMLPIVQVHGLGGQGKTALARYVAGVEAASEFDAIVWLSDKDAPGSVTLQRILDTILSTLDFPGTVTLPTEEKARFTHKLMASLRVLLVIDNYETVDDPPLANWLRTEIPESSRVVLTSREAVVSLATVSHLIHLEGLDNDEIGPFLEQLLRRLGLATQVADPASLGELARATGGNPKAMEVALGLVKRGRPLTEVLDWVRTDRSLVLDDLFERAWISLSDTARAVLVGMLHLRPTTDDEPLLAASGLPGPRALVGAVGELVDLSLLDILQDDINRPPLYELHPLVSTFLDSRVCGDPRCSVACQDTERRCSFELLVGETRERWLTYAVDLASRVGFCPGDVNRLNLLDVPGRRHLIESAASWALANKRYAEAVQIGRESRYFFYVRGLWDDAGSIHLIRADAAHALGDACEEFDARTYFVNISAKQGHTRAFERELQQLEQLVPQVSLFDHSLSEYQHAKALCLLDQARMSEAIELWRDNLGLVRGVDEAQYSANLRWLAVALARDGRPGEAMALLSEAAAHAERHGFSRAKVAVALEQANLLLDTGAGDEAGTHLDEVAESIESLDDRNYRAEFALLRARQLATTDVDLAREFAREAADIYQRLGHVHGHATASLLLDSLE